MRSASGRGHARVTAFAATLVLLGLGACKDSGLLNRNSPLAEAMHRPSRYPVYEATSPASTFIVRVGGQSWITAGQPEAIPQALLKPVATAQGVQLYALVWDQSPYTRLYVSAEDGGFRSLARAT